MVRSLILKQELLVLEKLSLTIFSLLCAASYCGRMEIIMAKKCIKCGNTGGFIKDAFFVNIKGKDHCQNCAKQLFEEEIKDILITTTNNIDDHKVSKYIDIESVEIVMGTGTFSEFGGDIADFFGARSSVFEQKLQKAKRTAFERLKYLAYEKEGNAVIGIDIDYTEFSGNRIGVVANGTIVFIERIIK